MEVANPLDESFGETPKACVQNPVVPRQTLKEKETQISHWFVQSIGLLTWLSVCILTFNHLVLSTFW